MKYSIIDDIYFAKRGNLESINLNDKEKQLYEKQDTLIKKLKSELSDSRQSLLNEIFELQTGINFETQKARFKEGMKIGLLLGAESLS